MIRISNKSCIFAEQITKRNKSMKSEKENKEVNTNEVGVAIGVDSEVIEKVRSG
jgi:hypothetical protein